MSSGLTDIEIIHCVIIKQSVKTNILYAIVFPRSHSSKHIFQLCINLDTVDILYMK